MSLKTPDHALATSKAEKAYDRAVWQAEESTLPGKMSFDKVAKAFLASIEPNANSTQRQINGYKSHRGVIQRYLSPYFGNRTITSMTGPKLNEYVEWRRTYWTSGPGKDLQKITYERDGRVYSRPAVHAEPGTATIRREAVTLSAVCKYAARKGLVPAGSIPKLEFGKGARNRRPSFSMAEIARLQNLAASRILDVSKNQKLRYERTVLYCFARIAVESGMRPTELHNLDWSNVEGFLEERDKPIGEARIRIWAHGKGLAPTKIVPNIEALSVFDNLWEAYSSLHGREPNLTDPVFTTVDGKRLTSTKNSLNALLVAAGLKEDAFGNKRTAYSFRHTYASNQIRKGTDVYSLSINMRTSVRMIEMYYSDVQPHDLAVQLEGTFD